MLNGGVSQFVPKCPRLSSFVPICPRSGPQEGQKRTSGDKTGHFGTNWETRPFSIYPHLALLNFSFSLSFFLVQGFAEFSDPNPGMKGPKALQGATIDSYLHPDWISEGSGTCCVNPITRLILPPRLRRRQGVANWTALVGSFVMISVIYSQSDCFWEKAPLGKNSLFQIRLN